MATELLFNLLYNLQASRDRQKRLQNHTASRSPRVVLLLVIQAMHKGLIRQRKMRHNWLEVLRRQLILLAPAQRKMMLAPSMVGATESVIETAIQS